MAAPNNRIARRWRLLVPAAAVALVAACSDGGADAGSVHPANPDELLATTEEGLARSTDGGTTWTSRGTIRGAPQALTTHDTTEVYVATETGIHHSSDGGATFTLRQPLT